MNMSINLQLKLTANKSRNSEYNFIKIIIKIITKNVIPSPRHKTLRDPKIIYINSLINSGVEKRYFHSYFNG